MEPTQLVGRVRQAEVFLAGAVGRRQPVPADPTRLEEAARRVMSPEAFAYVAGGAGMESTIAAGREAFEHWKIVPRMLRDVSHGDTSVELFGRRIPALFSPPRSASSSLRTRAQTSPSPAQPRPRESP